MYNNILIYVVGHPPGELSPSPAEMHIFQCVNVRARDVVEDLKAFMHGGGGGKAGARGHHQGHEIEVGDLPPYGEDELAGEGTLRRSCCCCCCCWFSFCCCCWTNDAFFVVVAPVVGDRARMQAQLGGGGNNDETSSTSSDRYERDVAVLNRCFDDIEKFIARLQHAAAAFRELEKRRRSRRWVFEWCHHLSTY